MCLQRKQLQARDSDHSHNILSVIPILSSLARSRRPDKLSLSSALCFSETVQV